jgi:hypothetical protein
MPEVTMTVNLDGIPGELERLQDPPYAELEAVFAATFVITEARVHVETGALKASGHPTSEVGDDTWTGTLNYDRYPGIYELARGPVKTKTTGGTGTHFFFDPVEARWPGDWTTGDSYQMYTKAILDWLEG